MLIRSDTKKFPPYIIMNLERTLIEADIHQGSQVSRMFQSEGDNSRFVSTIQKCLRDSESTRVEFPMFLDDMAERVLNDPSIDLAEVEGLFRWLPQVCNTAELHTFGLEVWIKIWTRTCECAMNSRSDCRLSVLRSLLAMLLNEAIIGAKSGYLYSARENYLMSLGGQVLSKFWLPETVEPRHRISSSWIRMNTGICQSLMDQPSITPTDNQVFEEVCIRLLSAQLEALVVRVSSWFSPASLEGFEDSVRPLHQLFLEYPTLLNVLGTKLSNLDPSVQAPVKERHADFELVSSDLALFVLVDSVIDLPSPRLIPTIWSKSRKADVLNRTCSTLLRSEHVAAGMVLAVRSIDSLRPSNVVLEQLIEKATTFGDETFMSITDRKTVFTCIQTYLNSMESADEAIAICTEIIERSRVDSVVGIFVKILKDIWNRKSEKDFGLFFRVASVLLIDPFPVMDGLDTLKSVLNWARLAILLSPKHMTDEMEMFRKTLDKISRNIDVELSKHGPSEDDIGKTRLLFIAHLVARVKELLSQYSH